MRESEFGTAATLPTARIIGWVTADLDIIEDDAATPEQRAAAMFRLDKNYDALDRRRAGGDADAAAFLAADAAADAAARLDRDAPADDDDAAADACPDCARSFGPHYTGPCHHADGAR